MNIAACIAVVALHVNGGFWGFAYSNWWKFSLFIETSCYWAVPVFFMLTGATLMDYRKRYNSSTFLKKRFHKTVIPFLFWSAVSIPWAVYISHYLDITSVATWKDIFNVFINQQAMSIYWFFPPLFAIYLCIPLLSAIPEDKRKFLFSGTIVYSFLSYSLYPTIAQILGLGINYAFQNPLNGGGYLVFVLLGYCITSYPLKKKQRLLIYISGFCGWAIRYFYTLSKSYDLGYIDSTFSGYVNFPSVLLAVAVFTWFWYHDWSLLENPNIVKVIRQLSSASFGVYLIHFYILRFIIDTFCISMQSYGWSILGIPFVYGLSLTLVLVFKRIPFINNFIP